MHSALLQKLENEDCWFCISLSVADLGRVNETQSLENVYATVNRKNEFREGAYLLFRLYDPLDADNVLEDDCKEGEQVVETEWVAHDQVFIRVIDFTQNAEILK